MSELLTQLARTYEADEVIFCEYEPGEELFIIKSGRVKISKIETATEKTLAILGPGDIFGEMAIIEQKPRSATAVTLEKTEVLVIHRDNFQSILQSRPEFLVRLIQIFCYRIWVTSHQLRNYAVKHPQGRLANILAMLAEAGRKKADQTEIQLDLTVEELGQMIELSSEETLQILENLQREDAVKIVNEKIVVCNSFNMRRKADFYLKTEQFKSQLN
jgi:CRP-like cAMP-binding protein